METTIGLVGKGFAIVAADRSAARSIVVFKQDEDKVLVLDKFKLLGSAGVAADSVAFTEYVQKNMALYEINSGLALSTRAASNFIRGELATALRRGPYQTNLLLGGYDAGDGASLYYIDYLASCNKVNFGCHGYASNFVLSILDREWKDGLTEEEGIEIIRKCIAELQVRFLVSLPKFTIKIVDHNGTRDLPQPVLAAA
ncbi:hypothetical protein CTAYLR_003572 [Chrysophaeum taylorii]|uniref:Proteasome subunit beta n=1 Tax=Chrysophaeum taylorii TaxID=2483200 RepID=A0AAD7UL53_9STRA|nr:hypothetical protein CTAYLR_003572 [Chrysophaeum taylorii]